MPLKVTSQSRGFFYKNLIKNYLARNLQLTLNNKDFLQYVFRNVLFNYSPGRADILLMSRRAKEIKAITGLNFL